MTREHGKLAHFRFDERKNSLTMAGTTTTREFFPFIRSLRRHQIEYCATEEDERVFDVRRYIFIRKKKRKTVNSGKVRKKRAKLPQLRRTTYVHTLSELFFPSSLHHRRRHANKVMKSICLRHKSFCVCVCHTSKQALRETRKI